jgi:nitrogen fixation protein FixH
MGSDARHHTELTGRRVLVYLVVFFAVVAGVNAIMLRAATKTFGGLETPSAYRAGLAFNRELAAVAAQDSRQWKVDGTLTRRASGEAELLITLRDGSGVLVSGVTLEARLEHPADARRDQPIEMTQTAPGQFRGSADIDPGAWTVSIDAMRGSEHLFRSKSRLGLR